MSEVVCRCPACTAKFKVDAKYAGKKARCPKCSVVVEVPAAGSEPVSSGTTVVPSITTQAPPKAVQPNVPPPPTVQPHVAAASAGSSSFPPLRTTAVKSLPVSRPLPPPPPKEQPVDALIEEAVAAEFSDPALSESKPSDPAPSESFGFQLKTSGRSKSSSSLSSSTATHSHSAHDSDNAPASRGKKSSGSALPVIIAGVAALVLVAGGSIWAVIHFSQAGHTTVAKNNKGGSKAAAATKTGKLVLDWPVEDRKPLAGVLIDGKGEIMLTKGELYFDLSPGEHTVLLKRRGYDQVESKVTITKGQVTTFKPEWKKNEFGTAPAVATTNKGSGNPGTDFPIGMATGATVSGFEGFTQNFYAAKDLALKSQKPILIIFGSSDSDPRTMELGRATQAPDTKAQILAAYIPVIIDFPRQREARENVYDAPLNSSMAKEFSLRQLPMMTVLDPKGKGYYLQSDWKKGTGDLKGYLQEAAAARTERDELWAAVKGESLEPAVKLVTWLMEKKLITRYGDELKKWSEVAQRLDAANDLGQLECFIEAELMVKAVETNPENEIDVNLFVAPLKDWLTAKKFKDDDRGARLHLLAGGLLARAERKEEAMAHLARAASYSPKDPKLKEAIASAKTVVERGSILSTGTGFVVSEAGYIMTNSHVIAGPGKVIVRMPDGETTVEGKVVAQDPDRDMALVKLEFPAGVSVKSVSMSPATIGRGIQVAAFGYPLARSVKAALTATFGGVSAIPGDANDQMFTLDMRVNPGNSGGPLCDQKGNVVGMVTAKTRTNAFSNEDSYGMAIPAADLAKFLDKHLPAGTPRPKPSPAVASLPWSDVDVQVSPGVLLILKME